MRISGFTGFNVSPANKAPLRKGLPLFGLNPDQSPRLTPPQSPLTPPRTPTPPPEDTVSIAHSPQRTTPPNHLQALGTRAFLHLNDVASDFETIRDNTGRISSNRQLQITLKSMASAIHALAEEVEPLNRRQIRGKRYTMSRSIRALFNTTRSPEKAATAALRRMGKVLTAVKDTLPEAAQRQIKQPIQNMNAAIGSLRSKESLTCEGLAVLESIGKATQAVAQVQGHGVDNLNLKIFQRTP